MTELPAKLYFPRALHGRLIEQSQASPAVEICGLLIGRDDEDSFIEDVVFVPNVASQPRIRFEIDPQVQFDYLRKLRGTSQRIIGHVHSHPIGQAIPSASDLEMAHDPEAIWVIIGLSPKVDVQAYTRPDQSQGFRALAVVLT